jgi:carboxyl-terminal processing protease
MQRAAAVIMNHRRRICIHAISFVVFCWLAIAAQTADAPRILTPDSSSFESLSRFTELLDALQKNYLQPARIDGGQHTAAALRAFVRSLDPEADLLTPDEVAATNASASAMADTGLRFALSGDYPTVISPRDDSPAQDAGVLAGEQIVAIDKTPLLYARRIVVEELLRGPVNSRVTLRVLDPTTSAIRDLRLLRAAPTSSSSVALKFLDNGVAYCRVPEFTLAVVENLRAAMARAKKERASGVILDLRNNAGGAFEAAQVAASMFLPKDANIVALEYAHSSQHATFVSNEGGKFTMPLVILVNAGTAAEAEMFAAALHDNKRARIVGSRTFGRGFLVASIALSDGSVLSLPTAYYMPPSREIFQGTGLMPDVFVDLPRQTERLIERIGFNTFKWPSHRTQVLGTDLPLARALSLLSK